MPNSTGSNSIRTDVVNPNLILCGPANVIWLGVAGVVGGSEGASGAISAKQRKRELSRALEDKLRIASRRRRNVVEPKPEKKLKKKAPVVPLAIQPSESYLQPAQLESQPNYGPSQRTMAMLEIMKQQKQQAQKQAQDNELAVKILTDLV